MFSAQGLLRLYVLGLDDTVIIFSDIYLINKSHLPSIVALCLPPTAARPSPSERRYQKLGLKGVDAAEVTELIPADQQSELVS